jgi:CubicO group peptidase (beta-lactamase class C family)
MNRSIKIVAVRAFARATGLAQCALLLLFAVPAVLRAQQSAALAAWADHVFSQWTRNTPGCALGVAKDGQTILTRGYGMANLETSTPITPQTIFESGSVAKQFTATAILLLAHDGKLNLDDPAKKYLPELPDYGRPLLVRHLLSHTSGLRDWSNLVAMAGWPRETRLHSQPDLLEYVFAQKAINYPVGDFYSYTNSGFALLEAIVERVSGMPFTKFTDERIFKPLGMTDTRWRDDLTTIVPGRAQAYARRGDGWRLEMPFEDVIGPGGLLTTVADWLKWNDALTHKTLGAFVVDSLEKQATLTSGRRITYAMGLEVTNYRGIPEIGHSGSTGGYSTYLTRFPRNGVSIAILCNASGAGATGYAHQLVDSLTTGFAATTPPDTVQLDSAKVARLAGVYRSLRTHDPLLFGIADAGGRGRGGRGGRGGAPGLRELRGGGYLLGNNHVLFDVGANGKPRGLRVVGNDADTAAYAFVSKAPWTPAAAELTDFAGRYRSDEVGATYTVLVENGQLVITLRAAVRHEMNPSYKDAFTGWNTVWFTRDAGGKVTAMHVGAARMWDLVLPRVK